MADARRLPVYNLMASALVKFKPYTIQELSNKYLDKIIQSQTYLERYMGALPGKSSSGTFF